ncbi:Pep12 [Kluyveromyces lactis]|nr:Pep12 [Kluyveromyces lactis]
MSDSPNEILKYRDNPEFEDCCDAISQDLFELNGSLSTMNHFVTALETNVSHGKSNTKVIDNINKKTVELIDKSTKLVSSINENIHKVNELEESALDKPHLITREKLTRDAKFSVQEFKKYQQHFLEVTKRINDMAKVALEDEEQNNSLMDTVLREEEDTHAKRTQVVIEREPINNEEFAYQQHLIRERDQEISNIEQGITELNGIFKDLGGLVQQQGQLVDSIEANLYNVEDNTRNAANELSRAMRSGRGSSKLKLHFLFILLFFLLLTILAVFS